MIPGRSWPLLALAATVLSLAPAVAAEERPSLQVTYLANEGVLMEAGGARVVVDALLGDGLEGYWTLSTEARQELESGEGRLAGVQVALVTHAHADHLDPGTAARFLTGQPRASLVGPPQVVGAVRRALGEVEGVEDRLYEYLPEEGRSWQIHFPEVGVEVFNLHHGTGMEVENVGYLVEIGGWRVLHAGDAAVTAAEVEPYGFDERGIDLALLPFWYLLDPEGEEVVAAVGAEEVAGIHVPAPSAPGRMFGSPGSLGELQAAVAARYPEARLFTEPWERWVLGGAPGPPAGDGQ